jgi:hypothetical protein
VISGNLVADNNNLDAPYKSTEYAAFGNGILVAGGVGNIVEHNTVANHENNGILITPNLDKSFWFASGNEVKSNVVYGSGRADIAVSGPAGEGNCLSDNDFETSAPFGLQALYGCTGIRLPFGYDISGTMLNLGYVAGAPNNDDGLLADVARQPVPPPQGQMPEGAGAPVVPAVDVFDRHRPVLSSISQPANVRADVSREVIVSGIALAAPGGWQLLFGLYGYLLPFVLYAAWTSLAFWDIARRASGGEPEHAMVRGAAIAWVAAILLIPFVGAAAYHALGRSAIPGWLRALFVAGGLGAYLIILVVGSLVGGVV